MTLDEARACLADYKANPIPRDSSTYPLYSMSICSDDGETFEIGLNDYDGFSDAWSTVEDYTREIAELRRLGIHRWHGHPELTPCPLGDDCPGFKRHTYE